MSVHCTCCTNELLDIHEKDCHTEVPLIVILLLRDVRVYKRAKLCLKLTHLDKDG